MKVGEALLRLLLRLTPRGFRDRWGEELLQVHTERARARSRAGRWVFLAREVVGLIALAAGLRLGRAPGRGESAVDHVAEDRADRLRGARRGERAWMEVRFALRTLRRNPGFTLTAVAVLALGIGANTAIFSAANAYFFRPLPFADPHRLVMLYETNPEFGWTDAQAAPANVLDWREQVAAFQDVAMYADFVDDVTYVHEGEPLLLDLAVVSGNFFEVLGVPADLGRTFRWEETWDGRDDVVVLSHGLWQSLFGGDPGVIGRAMDFGTVQVEIAGVMPAGFRFPGDDVQLWTPFGWSEAQREQVSFRRAHWLRAIARIAPGVSMEEADAQLQVVVARLQREYPQTNEVMGAGLMPLRDFLIRGIRATVLALSGAVALLLLLACVNVANLALVRASDRTREVALRQALGAGRRRVASLLAAESLLLAAGGGALGLGLGWLGVRAIERHTSLGIEGATGVALDHRVVLVTLAATLLSALLFGLAPLLRATRADVQAELRAGGRTASIGRRGVSLARALVAAEVALALVLAVGAGLMVRTAMELREVDPGFRPEGVLGVQFTLPESRYPQRDQVLAFYDSFIAGLEARPGIERAGVVAKLPLEGRGWSGQFNARGWPEERMGLDVVHRRADRGYFEALRIPLIRGRLFEETDRAGSPPVVLINETLARQLFPGEEPVGQMVTYDRIPDESSVWREIIGIVGDQHQVTPGERAVAEVFEHRDQHWSRTNWVVVRTAMDPMAALPMVRTILHELDPMVPIASARPLREVWRASMAREELVLVLLGTFGALALLLAVVGVYGVTAQAARQRTREIGIRLALGATRRDVVWDMVRQGLVAVVLGLGLGTAAAVLAARALDSLLFGVTASDPATLAAVSGVLVTAAALASWLPAARGARVDPVSSLNAE